MIKSFAFLSAAAGLLLSGQSTAVQEGNQTGVSNNALSVRITACREIESSLERLDCYDRIARSLSNAGQTRSDVEDDRQGRSSSRGQERAEDARAQAAAAREAAAERQQRLQDEARERRDDFGKEHRGEFGDDDQRRYVTIEESWQNPRGLWRFRTDDGAEWHQVQGGRYFALDADAAYYIERGALNSFRLSHEDTNRSINVRRVD